MWMSHGDRVASLPHGFSLIGETPNAPNAAVADEKRQASTASSSTPRWRTRRAAASCSANFLFRVCKLSPSWTMANFAEEAEVHIRDAGGRAAGACILGLSGGVDSSVAAKLLLNAIGERLTCIFVDNGLLRQGERAGVEALFAGAFKADLHVVDAEARFLTALAGVTDPEQKRKIIGREFIAVFEEEAKRIDGARVPRAGHALSRRHRERLAQGAVGDDQEPPQRRRAARAHEAQARRAAARAVQGRGARARRRAGPAAARVVAPAVPRARGWRCACSAR